MDRIVFNPATGLLSYQKRQQRGKPRKSFIQRGICWNCECPCGKRTRGTIRCSRFVPRVTLDTETALQEIGDSYNIVAENWAEPILRFFVAYRQGKGVIAK